MRDLFQYLFPAALLRPMRIYAAPYGIGAIAVYYMLGVPFLVLYLVLGLYVFVDNFHPELGSARTGYSGGGDTGVLSGGHGGFGGDCGGGHGVGDGGGCGH